MRKIKKAILPVAGMGTRFLPATKAMPKEMMPVLDKPLIQYAVEEAFDAGIEEVILVTGRGKNAIANHFDFNYELDAILHNARKFDEIKNINSTVPKDGTLIYTRQGQPLGLGHAIWCARSIIGNEPFAILLADDIFQGDKPVLDCLLDAYQKVGGNVVSLMQVPKSQVTKYGIVSPSEINGAHIKIAGLVEKPTAASAPSDYAISGRYILQPDVFNYLAQGKKGTGGEIQLTDAMAQLIGQQSFLGILYDGTRFDCGSVEGWLEANIAFASIRPELKSKIPGMIKKYWKDPTQS